MLTLSHAKFIQVQTSFCVFAKFDQPRTNNNVVCPSLSEVFELEFVCLFLSLVYSVFCTLCTILK